jgi:YD repeat-containing protein
MIGTPLQTVTTKLLGGQENITSGALTTYQGITVTNPGTVRRLTVRPAYSYMMEFEQPPAYSGLTNFTVSYSGNSEVPAFDSRFIPHTQLVSFDARGNAALLNDNASVAGVLHNTSYLWGYNHLFPVAEVKNAALKDIFYDNFEDGDGNSLYGDAKTGHYSFSGPYSATVSGIDNGSYLLTYWSKVSGVWTPVITNITVSAGSYTVSLTGQVDDVRFYPASALMSTYTYDRLIGLTSSTDASGRTAYYEYDSFQRLMNVKDQNGNIVKNYKYNYQQ